jgi:lysophospholipase L1-like esterase
MRSHRFVWTTLWTALFGGGKTEPRSSARLGVCRLEERTVPNAVRILAIGDSNTQGGDFGQASYRYPLYEQLSADGFRVDMVGSRDFVNGQWPGNPDPANYPNYFTTFDRDHEAYWGWDTGSVLPRVRPAAEAGNPDFVLLMLGSNDVGRGGQAAIPGAIVNLEAMVADLRAVRPDVTILMAQVLPFGPNNGYTPNAGWVDDFNAEVAALAGRLSTPQSRVVVVDQYTGFDVAQHMSQDGLHPNRDGERLVATTWYNALRPLLGNPPPRPAVPVAVGNPSFEAVGLSDGGVTAESGARFAWAFDTPANTQAGYWNTLPGAYTGADGNSAPAGGSGGTLLWLFNDQPGGAGPTVTQTLAETLYADAVYTLTVGVGRRLPTDPYGTRYGGYRVELLAGDTVIASSVNAVTPAAGRFFDVTLTVNTLGLDPALLGQPLTIRFGIPDGGSRAVVDFDNVRLSRTGGVPFTPPGRGVAVANPSFEAVGLSDGGVTAHTGTAFGWEFAMPGDGNQGGFWNTDANSYLGAGGNNRPAGGDGSTLLWLFDDSVGGPGPSASQTLTELLQSNTRYRLTVAVGNRFELDTYAVRWGGYRVELLAGGTVVGASVNEFTPAPGTFRDVTVTVDTRLMSLALLGQPLTVRLSMTDGGNRAATDFDHVRLRAEEIVPTGPRVSGVLVNDGAAQRSKVSTIRVEFDGEVEIDRDAVSLVPVGGGEAVSIWWTTRVENGRTLLTIDLSCLPGGSLADGRYTLTVRGSGVRANGQAMAADFVTSVHRLYGDATGDATVDAADRAAFDAAFGSCWESSNYADFLDVDGDGFVWLSDLEAFEANYGRQV